MKHSIVHNFNLSIKLYNEGCFSQAISELIKLEYCSDFFKGYWGVLAACYQKVGQLALSKAAFLKAIERDKLNFELYAQFANLLVSLRDYEAAEINYSHAIRLNPHNHIFHYNLGLLYFNRGFYFKAANSLKISLAINPDHEKSFYLLAQSQVLSGSDEYYLEAKSSLSVKLKDNPVDRRALKLLADILWLQNDSSWNAFYNGLCDSGEITLDILGDYVSKLIDAGMPEYAEQVLVNVSYSMPNLNVKFLNSYVAYSLGKYNNALEWLNMLTVEHHDVDIFQRLMIYIKLALFRPQEALDVAKKLTSDSRDTRQEDIALLATCYKNSHNWSAYRELYNFDKMIKVLPISIPDRFSSLENFNSLLEDKLLELHLDETHPLEQSLRNGLQTAGHLFNNSSGIISELEKSISLCVSDFINTLPDDLENPFFSKKSQKFNYTGSWSVKLFSKGFHRNHFHNSGWISGCYYVNVPKSVDREGQGWIKFGEMESNSAQGNNADLYIKPVAGCVVLFPSYMLHGTVPFISDEYRLTIAFDLIPD